MVDTSLLERFLIKENDLLLLGIAGPQQELYVPMRVMARTEQPYLYDTAAEGALPTGLAASTSANGITGITFQQAIQLGSTNLPNHPTDVFDISNYPNYVYQMFYGIDPPSARVYLQQPFHTNQGALPIIGYYPSYAQEGYRDGFLSPLNRPHYKTQTIVLPGLSVAFAFANITPQQMSPLLNFYINALEIGVVKDASLVFQMITDTLPGEKKAKILTVGGLQSMGYNPRDYYKIAGITLDMNENQIAGALQ